MGPPLKPDTYFKNKGVHHYKITRKNTQINFRLGDYYGFIIKEESGSKETCKEG